MKAIVDSSMDSMTALTQSQKEQPLYVVSQQEITCISMPMKIKCVEIYAFNKIIVVQEDGVRCEVPPYLVSIPELPNFEAYQTYFKKTFLEIKPLNDGQYKITPHIKGVAGGNCGSKKTDTTQAPVSTKEPVSNENNSSGLTLKEKQIIEQWKLINAIKGEEVSTYDQKYGSILHVAIVRLTYDEPRYRTPPEVPLLLIKGGANVNFKDRDGNTPLSTTLSSSMAEEQKITLATALIKAGADVNAKDATHGTVSHNALAHKVTTLVALFIDHGADVNERDKNSVTIFHKICHDGYLTLALQAISKVKDINSVDKDGNTPLSSACKEWHPEIIKLLLDHGADPKNVISGTFYNWLPAPKQAFLNANINSETALLHETAEQIAGKIFRAIAKDQSFTREALKAVKTALIEVLEDSKVIIPLCDEENHKAMLARQSLAEYLEDELVSLLNNRLVFDSQKNTLDRAEFELAIKDKLSQWKQANIDNKKLLKLEDNDSKSSDTEQVKTAEEWFEEGKKLFNQQQHKEAIECFDRVIQLETNHYRAYQMRGDAKREKGDYKGAIEDYEVVKASLEESNEASAVKDLKKINKKLDETSEQQREQLKEARRKRDEEELQQLRAENATRKQKEQETKLQELKSELSTLKQTAIREDNLSSLNQQYQTLEKKILELQDTSLYAEFYVAQGDFYLETASKKDNETILKTVYEKALRSYKTALQYDPFLTELAEKIEKIENKLNSYGQNTYFFAHKPTLATTPTTSTPKREELTPEQLEILESLKAEQRQQQMNP